MTLGSEGATAIEPVEEIGWSSNTGFQESPPSSDLQTPPEAVAAKKTLELPGTPATRATRPPQAGPRRRYLRDDSPSGSLSSEGGAAAAAAVSERRRTEAKRTERRATPCMRGTSKGVGRRWPARLRRAA